MSNLGKTTIKGKYGAIFCLVKAITPFFSTIERKYLFDESREKSSVLIYICLF